MDTKERILELMKLKGPILPKDLTKELNIDLTLAGAYLSELAGNNKILISRAKVGGSPVYYLQEQSAMLEPVLYPHLGEKEKKAFDMLKHSKVLKDTDLSPLLRVVLRDLKDFAVPLTVNFEEGKQIYWKWLFLSNDEVESMIKKSLTKNERVEPKSESPKQNVSVDTPHEIPHQPTSESKGAELKHQMPDEDLLKVKDELKKLRDEFSKERSKLMAENKQLLEKNKQLSAVNSQKNKSQKSITEITDASLPVSKPSILRTIDSEKDEFFLAVKDFLLRKNAEIINFEIITKKSEVDFIARMPSEIGLIEYYVKARKKARSNDGDVSAAFVKGQLKKLPILFLTTGDMTKKAKDLIEKEFKNFIVLKMEV